VQQWGTPPSKGYKAVINSGVNLEGGDQIYFLANFAHIETNESFNYRLPVDFMGASGASYSHHPAFNDFYLTPCPANNATCPAGGFVFDANKFNYNTSVYPSGYTPRFFGTTQELLGTVGYKGTNSHGMSYDLSGTLAQNYLNMSLRSSINMSLGPQSPTDFYIGKFQQQEANLNFDVSYPWKVAAFTNPPLDPVLLENIAYARYNNPTPVQKYSIPIVANNRDLMACAQVSTINHSSFYRLLSSCADRLWQNRRVPVPHSFSLVYLGPTCPPSRTGPHGLLSHAQGIPHHPNSSPNS